MSDVAHLPLHPRLEPVPGETASFDVMRTVRGAIAWISTAASLIAVTFSTSETSGSKGGQNRTTSR